MKIVFFGWKVDLFSFIVFIAVLTFCVACVVYRTKTKKYGSRMEKDRETIKNCFPDDKDKRYVTQMESVLDRRYNYIKNYILFQVLAKTSDGLSLWFSVSTLSLTALEESDAWKSTLISVFAMVFVIISIYIVPMKRAKEYLNAWRKCDHMIQFLPTIDPVSRIIRVEGESLSLEEYMEYCAQTLEKIEASITTDEE